jgi:hypothetical protein
VRSVAMGALLAALCACRSNPPGNASTGDSTANAGRIAFAITAPRAGDTLAEGRSYTIRWMAPDTMRINLGAAMGGKDKGLLLSNVQATPDSLVWTIPTGFVTGFGVASSGQVRLRLENAANPDQWTEAGPFTVSGTITRE